MIFIVEFMFCLLSLPLSFIGTPLTSALILEMNGWQLTQRFLRIWLEQ